MRSKSIFGLAVMMVLSAFADRPHDIFNAHRDEILSSGISVIEGTIFLTGRSISSSSRGSSLGWTKAEESAKWNLGERYRNSVQWPQDVNEEEKSAAWLEYRSMHPNRFFIKGMQRVFKNKIKPDEYVVVLAFPSGQVDLSPPSKNEIDSAVAKVRERKRLTEGKKRLEMEKKKAEVEARKRQAGYREEVSNGAVKQQQVDEDLIL